MKGHERIEQKIRQSLTGPKRHNLQAAMGWDDSQVSRFLSGSQGVVIDKLDTLVGSLGFILVGQKYLDAVSTLGEVGMFCECARQGLGECGNNERRS